MLSTVIVLKGYDKAESHLPQLLGTAQQHGWNITVFEAINGLTESFPFKIDQRYPKAARDLSRPGVRGCFLSHYAVWQSCRQTIAVFEHDVVFKKPPPITLPKADIIKLAGFRPAKPASTGQWWGGAYAYIITPIGAEKLIRWVEKWGASPADYMLGDKVAHIAFDTNERIELVDIGSSSTTCNLEQEFT